MAVGLAALALVGVAGPLLIWRASKTARNQALAALDKGPASSSGFVTKGFHVGRDIRLFRRVRAPDLKQSPNLRGQKPVWNHEAPLSPKESASWVQLGSAIQAYGLPFDRGDCLTLRGERFKLDVSRNWLIVIGLLGRFGLRPDGGKWPTKRPKGVTFEQAVPGLRIGDSQRPVHLKKRLYTGVPHDLENWVNEYSAYRHNGNVQGLVGTMYNGLQGGIEFSVHQQQDVGEFSEEVLDMAALFWLAVGCLPLLGSDTVYSLENVQHQVQRDDSESDDDDETQTTNAARRRMVSYTVEGRPHFESSDDRPINHAGQRRRSRSSYVSSGRDRSDYRGFHPAYRNITLYAPRMLCFSTTHERAEDLFGLADAVGAESTGTQTMSLTEVTVTPDDMELLQNDMSRTFVPCDRAWVRLVRPVSQEPTEAVFFLIRADAQRLARALLQLPICAQGYLIYNPPGSLCRRMLVECCEFLPRLLNFMLADFDELRSPGRTWDACLSHLNTLFRLTENYSYKRTFARALYDVDCILQELTNHAPFAQLVIQVLAVTNPEFRDLISQSIRTLEACLPTSIVVDAKASTVNVGAAFGLIRKFPVDVDVLVDDEPEDIAGLGSIVIPYRDVLVLCLKASLRSTFLKTSLDSTPLFDWLMGGEEVLDVL